MLRDGVTINIVFDEAVGAQGGHFNRLAVYLTLAATDQALPDRLDHIMDAPTAVHQAMLYQVNRPCFFLDLHDAPDRQFEAIMPVREG